MAATAGKRACGARGTVRRRQPLRLSVKAEGLAAQSVSPSVWSSRETFHSPLPAATAFS